MKRIIFFLLVIGLGFVTTSCKNNKTQDNADYYTSILMCMSYKVEQNVSYITTKIDDGVLYFDEIECGKLVESSIPENFWYAYELHFYEKYIMDYDRLHKNVTTCYVVKNINNSLIENGNIYLLELDNEKYMFICDDNSHILKGFYLDYLENNKVEVYFESYQGGCIHLNVTKNLQIGSTYDLKELKQEFGAEAFIDLETFTIFEDELKVTKKFELVKYNNGVYDSYIEEYLFISNVFFLFRPGIYYEYYLHQYINEFIGENIVIDMNDKKYYFTKSNDYYYLSKVEGTGPIFNNYDKAKKELDILYGSSNYERERITVKLTENSFVVELGEPSIIG